MSNAVVFSYQIDVDVSSLSRTFEAQRFVGAYSTISGHSPIGKSELDAFNPPVRRIKANFHLDL
jgi:hypothetical protein